MSNKASLFDSVVFTHRSRYKYRIPRQPIKTRQGA